ncbi:MAG TPA: sigma-70 family RNA polymerase sigma factor [Thermoanaerobaculia bacterium]|jgi:RNA polymerase sigma-70 factor (ECF subfamily)
MADEKDRRFEELYEYYPGAVAFLRNFGFSAEQANDLAQDAFVRVLKGIDRYRGEARWAYVKQTVRNVAMNEIRARHTAKRDGQTVSDELLVGVRDTKTPSPEAAMETKETSKRLRDAVAKLKPEDRTVLLLHLAGRSYDDMVSALGISLSAVKSRLNAARNRLKALLGEDPGL